MELRALKDKATEAFTKGRFSKAAELYEDYCRAEPKDHQSRLRMGDAWSKAGQRDRAVTAYQSAAEGFAKEGFLPRAIAASKLILELDPAHQGVQQMLADLYARRGTPATSRAKPKDGAPATPQDTPSLITQREVPPGAVGLAGKGAASGLPPTGSPGPASADAAGTTGWASAPSAVRTTPAPLEAGGASLDLSDSLPPELALTSAASTEARSPPVPEDTEVVLSVEVEVEPQHDEPGWDLTPEAPLEPEASSSINPIPPRDTAESQLPVPPASTPSSVARDRQPPGMSVRVAPPRTPPSPASMPELPQIRTPSGRWQALASPITGPDVPAATPPAAAAPRPSAPPGMRPRRTDAAATPTAPTPAAGATVAPTTAGAPEPWRASLRVSSFTELEIEADSLLHAVELAAQRGVADGAPEEEPVYELTEEAGPAAGSWDALPSIPLFSDLPREAFIQLFERCPLRRFGPGERILAQGSHGDAFYVICEGSVRVFREDNGHRQDLATLEGGAFFGEMALLSGAPRAASVESASDDTQVLEISASVLATLSHSHPPVAQALKKFCRERLLTNVMNGSALFRPFNRRDRRGLVERFRARDVERGDVIIREGDATDGLYVVLSGEVDVLKNGHVLSRLKEGDLFGEISLLQKTPATATVEAARHTTLLRLPREDFDSLISSHPQVLMLVSDLSDERLRRTQRLLDAATDAAGLPLEDDEDDLILV
ncbi:cyclic nucleotide-binding domain-containing protein [Corallococcus sp. bb12-1]|uniref:cyclic nucleotide-binding domain-containing protein n=1 Tax=Corallococcus sp. bb12-1 TaxID=2996784 RepID=UPI00226DE5D7|nr:cyclic nucleotide-binding domain-containing protein [Corallococcus sp. bb12-1]MCY1041617.1 cyclic nucleotide-binding domain-containing protein [Corallococcus sp. bb12-1]